MPVCYSTMFSFSGRSVARVCSAHVHLRNNISKFRDRWQLACCALQRGTVCRPSAGSKAALKMQLLPAESSRRALPTRQRLLTFRRSAAEFGARYRHGHHRRHRHGRHGRSRHLQLPHCKHPRCDRLGRGLIRGFVVFLVVGRVAVLFVVLPGERRRSVCAIFFEIGEHEKMLRQQPITFAELGRRRSLSRDLAFGRPSAITLCRRYVISHCPHQRLRIAELARLARGVKPACG